MNTKKVPAQRAGTGRNGWAERKPRRCASEKTETTCPAASRLRCLRQTTAPRPDKCRRSVCTGVSMRTCYLLIPPILQVTWSSVKLQDIYQNIYQDIRQNEKLQREPLTILPTVVRREWDTWYGCRRQWGVRGDHPPGVTSLRPDVSALRQGSPGDRRCSCAENRSLQGRSPCPNSWRP